MASYAEFKSYPGLKGYLSRLAGAHRTPEYRAMLGRVKAVLDEDYTTRALSGLTVAGAPVPDAAGIRARRRGRYRGLAGEPGTPRGRASRLITGYVSGFVQDGATATYIGKVVGFPAARHLIARFRYAGVSSRAMGRIRAVADQAMLSLVRSGPSR